jgi:transcriptional regulator of arginine metabolism
MPLQGAFWSAILSSLQGGRLANKRERHATIRDIVGTRPVASQEDLRKLLLQRGWDVTQSTLSRDLHEMRLARIPTTNGVRYAFPDNADPEETKATLEIILPALFQKIDGVGELIVLKTIVGGASPVAVALDSEDLPEVVGTIAGDDTILIICRSRQARERLTKRLVRLSGA